LTDPADLVQEACDLLAGYLPHLEELVAEPSSTQNAAAGMSPRPADTPEPWDAPAGRALMDGHEGVRRLEAVLKYMVAGHPGVRRGGSAGNTMAALDAIPRLAAGLPADAGDAAVRALNRWIGEAEALTAIDKARHWRTLPRPRTCRYCGCWFLKADMDARPVVIMCFAVGCQDANGLRPVATMGTDHGGRPGLTWADGTIETMPDLDG
jgi:hypothetical protein